MVLFSKYYCISERFLSYDDLLFARLQKKRAIRFSEIKSRIHNNVISGNVDLSNLQLETLPSFLKESVVQGFFYCTKNRLKTLENSPKEVKGTFNCSFNEIISLEGCPTKVLGDFDCYANPISFTEADIKHAMYRLSESIDNRRHMKPGLTAASMKRFVPKWHQTKVENVKLMNIKKGTSKKEYLSPLDVQQITQVFGVNPNIQGPVRLGNTGITLDKVPTISGPQRFIIFKV